MTKRQFLKSLTLACVWPHVLKEAEQYLAAAGQDDLVTVDEMRPFICGSLDFQRPAETDPPDPREFDAYFNTHHNQVRAFMAGEWIVLSGPARSSAD